MKLIEAKRKIDKLAYIPFKNYLSAAQYKDIILNKGKTGQILELTIGLQLSNTTLDFEDGELKIDVPAGCKHYDVMLVGDFHIKDIDHKILTGFDLLNNYCRENIMMFIMINI
mgnify:CR=1 FL=1